MQVRCPSCQTTIPFGESASTIHIHCAQCGTRFEPHSILLENEDDQTAFSPLDSTAGLLAAGDQISKYTILKVLGRGGFGTVYQGFDNQLERNVAIKLPRPGRFDSRQVELFVREARLAAQVSCPNIVSVFEIGSHEGQAYIVSDFIDGVSLNGWRKQRSPDLRASLKLSATLARALHQAHQAGIVHRDLKPGNVLVNASDQPFLTDFGLAKREMAGDESLAKQGAILGTPAYMSPEQAKGLGYKSDRRSDIYSLGVMVYELISGESPYRTSGSELLDAVRNARVSLIDVGETDAPEPLIELCRESLAEDPTDRPQTAESFADRLEEILHGLEKDGSATSTPTRRRILQASVLTLGAGACMAGGYFLFSDRDPKPNQENAHGQDSASTESQNGADSLITVHISTAKPGAKIAIAPIDEDTGLPIDADVVRLPERTPTRTKLSAGNYCVEVLHSPEEFQQVFRSVPTSTTATPARYPHLSWTVSSVDSNEISWPTINSIDAVSTSVSLSRVTGGEFQNGWEGNDVEPLRTVQVEDMFVCTHEVTSDQYLGFMGIFPKDWTFANRGRPPTGAPMNHVCFDEAVTCLEAMGLRLPTRDEFDFVFTNRGTTEFPSGEQLSFDEGWKVHLVTDDTTDRTMVEEINPPIASLASNLVEWTSSIPHVYGPDGQRIQLDDRLVAEFRQQRVLRGGPNAAVEGQLTSEEMDALITDRSQWVHRTMNLLRSAEGLGFRGVRPVRPRWIET